jgi:mono/diheme cytochrome c family protein
MRVGDRRDRGEMKLPRHVLPCFWLAALLAGFALVRDDAAGFQMETQPGEDTELGPVFLLSLGGKLYDDLWRVLDREPPPEANPAFPAAGLYASRESWRCVTCHGWDYSGAEVGGRRFPGLGALRGADPAAIAARLGDPAHPFPADQLPEMAVELLGFFISQGQYDRTDFFAPDGTARGHAEDGQAIFEGACIFCHQLDGRRFLEGERGDRSSLGWVVRNRPAQALHKILNGVPAAEMLSLRFMSDEDVADLLAYLQTLDPGER